MPYDDAHQPPRYYVVDSLIWAGAYPSQVPISDAGMQATVAWLSANDVCVIIDLTTPADGLPTVDAFVDRHAGMTVAHYPIRDGAVPSQSLMLAVLDGISQAVAAGQRVYVHCWGGLGRTGTVIACWLVRNGYAPAAALVRLMELRQGVEGSSPETDGQRAFVLAWQEPTPARAQQMRGLRDRYRGALLGLAIGDAVGTTLEFEPWPVSHPIDDMVGGGPFDLEAGQWTDDTSMALCMAESLITRQAFDAQHQLELYVRWWRHGYHSAKSYCFDIGMTTAQALRNFEETGAIVANTTAPNMAGNGSLMRLVPVVMAYAGRHADMLVYAGASSQTTHATRVAIEACQGYAQLLGLALCGAQRSDVFAQASAVQTLIPMIHDELAVVFAGSYQTLQPPAIQGSGYAVKSLEAALWAVWNTSDYRTAILAATNLGRDADTTAAIAGQLAGALYGEQGIPSAWRERVYRRTLFEWYAEELLGMAEADILSEFSS